MAHFRMGNFLHHERELGFKENRYDDASDSEPEESGDEPMSAMSGSA